MSHMISVTFHGRGRPGGFCASLAEARAVLETLGHHQFEISATSRAGAIFLGGKFWDAMGRLLCW